MNTKFKALIKEGEWVHITSQGVMYSETPKLFITDIIDNRNLLMKLKTVYTGNIDFTGVEAKDVKVVVL